MGYHAVIASKVFLEAHYSKASIKTLLYLLYYYFGCSDMEHILIERSNGLITSILPNFSLKLLNFLLYKPLRV